MREQEPKTKTLKASEARQQWSDVINQVFRRETRIIVEKSGIPVAAIISANDLQRMEDSEKRREEKFKALDATRKAFKGIPDKELEREISKAITTVRRQNRNHVSAAL